VALSETVQIRWVTPPSGKMKIFGRECTLCFLAVINIILSQLITAGYLVYILLIEKL
jgi:hypothetical protein